MNPTLDLGGHDRLTERLRRLTRNVADATPLMIAWRRILVEGNERGILAGLDKDGMPMRPVTYRPVGAAVRPSLRQRNTANARLRRGAFGGHGPLASGINNNLTPAEYRRLGGPPLAPRGAYSRTITNYKTDHAMLRPGYWQVTYWWEQVVSASGIPFLIAHFRGMSGLGKGGRTSLPRRDLRGIRPADREKVESAKRAWMVDAVRSA